MTDKQLPPDWATARALREAIGASTPESAITHLVNAKWIQARARELSAQQPERYKFVTDAENGGGEIVDTSDNTSLAICWNGSETDALKIVSALNAQQPDAARGERPIKVLGQNGEPYPTTLVGATFEQPARDGVVEAWKIIWDRAWDVVEAFGYDNLTEANLNELRLALGGIDDPRATQPPQQADGEAVGEIIANYETDAGTETVASITKPVPVGAKLYLRPTRGVEVTEAVIEHAQSIYDSTGEMAAVLQYALSGVQR